MYTWSTCVPHARMIGAFYTSYRRKSEVGTAVRVFPKICFFSFLLPFSTPISTGFQILCLNIEFIVRNQKYFFKGAWKFLSRLYSVCSCTLPHLLLLKIGQLCSGCVERWEKEELPLWIHLEATVSHQLTQQLTIWYLTSKTLVRADVVEHGYLYALSVSKE